MLCTIPYDILPRKTDNQQTGRRAAEKWDGGKNHGREESPEQRIDYLDACIVSYKEHGVDLEKTLRYMMKSNFSNEALWYVGTHW